MNYSNHFILPMLCMFTLSNCLPAWNIHDITTHQSIWGHFTIHFLSNLIENPFCCISVFALHITANICTCHDRTIVMPCGNSCSDQIIIIWLRVKWNFHWIGFMLDNWWVRCIPGYDSVAILAPTHYIYSELDNLWLLQFMTTHSVGPYH